jgi:hypothetical protein
MLIFERRTHNRSVNRTELYFLQQTHPEIFGREKDAGRITNLPNRKSPIFDPAI